LERYSFYVRSEIKVLLRRCKGMGKVVKSATTVKRGGTAMSPEARENQMIALAMDAAEQQLRDGTASSQVITHFLKLASSTERLEKRIKEQQANMLEAKTSQLKSMANQEETYAKAIKAMRTYQGFDDDYNDEYED
jgi:hypothetical protein